MNPGQMVVKCKIFYLCCPRRASPKAFTQALLAEYAGQLPMPLYPAKLATNAICPPRFFITSMAGKTVFIVPNTFVCMICRVETGVSSVPKTPPVTPAFAMTISKGTFGFAFWMACSAFFSSVK